MKGIFVIGEHLYCFGSLSGRLTQLVVCGTLTIK